MRGTIATFAALVLIWSVPLTAAPAQVVLMRHAENQSNSLELSVKGQERAAALAPYFLGSANFLQFNLPKVLFAQGVEDPSSPLRSLQTLLPLSYALDITTHTDFLLNQYNDLIQQIKTNQDYNGKLVIICWTHKFLADMAGALGVNPKPSPWKDDVYDRLWVITFKPEGEVVFQDMPQRLLFGDSPN